MTSSEIPFTKMHGLGNDYLYIDTRTVEYDQDWPKLARAMSERHFGVGSDGIILITHSDLADVGMRIFNQDGSEAEMCGNGIRGLAKWLFDRGQTGARQAVETGRGVLYPEVVQAEAGRAVRIRVDMGVPLWSRAEIGITVGSPGEQFIDQSMVVADETIHASAVSMGNPHLVIFGPLWDATRLYQWGPILEHHAWFPHRINVHSAEIESPERIRIHHWERGAGPTLACGTGIAATVALALATERASRRVQVSVPGGELSAAVDDRGSVFLEGPAVEVFSGVYKPD